MSLDEETIQIIVDAKTDEARKAEQALRQLGDQVKVLKGQLDAGTISQAQFESGFASLDRQMARTRDNLKGVQKELLTVGDRLTGAQRASAKFQTGLAAANIVQDVAQGGPAAGINNILGLAGNNGVRALGGEFLAAAGGAKFLAGAIGAVGAAATATFVLVDQGLKTNKLGWEDLGSVIDTLGGGTFSAIGKSWGDTFDSIGKSITSIVGGLAESTIGWNSAAEAVRGHKEEVDRNTEALEKYEKAAKAISGIKSEKQDQDEKRGKEFGKEAAGLDEKGLPGLIGRLAEDQAGEDAAKKFKVKRRRKDKDGKEVESEEELTGKQVQEEAITQDFANAIGGDKASQESIKRRVAGLRLRTSGLDDAQQGRDRDKEREARNDEEERELKAQHDEGERRRKRADELAKPLQDRYNLLGASGHTPDEAGVRRQLEKAGLSGEDAAAMSGDVHEQLKEGYEEEVRKRSGEKGLDRKGAEADLLKEHEDERAKKARQDADRAEGLEKEKKKDAVEKAEKATAGSGLEARTDNALLRSALASGGKAGVASKEVAEALSKELQGKGLGKDEADLASTEIVRKQAARLGDEVNEGALKPKEQKFGHIGTADYAGSIESAANDGTKLLTTTEAMKDKLTELVRIAQRGPRLQ